LELTPTLLIALVAACGLGIVIGWIIRPARVVMTTPPDLDRERTLTQAKHEALVERFQQHLVSTEQALEAVKTQQADLLAEIQGSPSNRLEAITETNAEPRAPRDYADSRGQLGNS